MATAAGADEAPRHARKSPRPRNYAGRNTARLRQRQTQDERRGRAKISAAAKAAGQKPGLPTAELWRADTPPPIVQDPQKRAQAEM